MAIISIINGGHRPNGQSPRIAGHIKAQLEGMGHTAYHINLAEMDMPMWDEGMWGIEPLAQKWQAAWQPTQRTLEASEGFVIVSPEYHGMVPAKLINFFMLAGNGPLLAHKPALLVANSAGIGGSYPVAELKGFTTKNNRMVYLPEHLIVRNNAAMFVENPPAEHAEAAAYTQSRLEWCLKLLENYVSAFNVIREVSTDHIENANYANGM